VAPLERVIPTVAALDAMVGLDARARAAVPVAGDLMAAPFELTWRGGLVDEATFELYEERLPLSAVSTNAYRAFLKAPACRLVRSLTIGNVACVEFESSLLLGDPVTLLAREGLPLYLERLSLTRSGPVSNAGDLAYLGAERVAPLFRELANVVELELGGCEKLGKLSLPRLRTLRLIGNITPQNLKDLARAELPALEHLELYYETNAYERLQRWHGTRALLRIRGMPRLTNLEISWLDLDESDREELEMECDDDEPSSDPGPWIDMIADSPVLRRLTRLTLQFNDYEREVPRLVERAADFAHLLQLSFYCSAGNTTLAHPTREAVAAAVARPKEAPE
jgi:hypothetical protein